MSNIILKLTIIATIITSSLAGRNGSFRQLPAGTSQLKSSRTIDESECYNVEEVFELVKSFSKSRDILLEDNVIVDSCMQGGVIGVKSTFNMILKSIDAKCDFSFVTTQSRKGKKREIKGSNDVLDALAQTLRNCVYVFKTPAHFEKIVTDVNEESIVDDQKYKDEQFEEYVEEEEEEEIPLVENRFNCENNKDEIYGLFIIKAHLLGRAIPDGLVLTDCNSLFNNGRASYFVAFEKDGKRCDMGIVSHRDDINEYSFVGLAQENQFVNDITYCDNILKVDEVKNQYNKINEPINEEISDINEEEVAMTIKSVDDKTNNIVNNLPAGIEADSLTDDCDKIEAKKQFQNRFNKFIEEFGNNYTVKDFNITLINCRKNKNPINDGFRRSVLDIRVNNRPCVIDYKTDTLKDIDFMSPIKKEYFNKEVRNCLDKVEAHTKSKKTAKNQKKNAKKAAKKALAIENSEHHHTNVTATLEDENETTDNRIQVHASILGEMKDTKDWKFGAEVFSDLIVADYLEGKIVYKQNVIKVEKDDVASFKASIIYSFNNDVCQLQVYFSFDVKKYYIYHERITTDEENNDIFKAPLAYNMFSEKNCVDVYGTMLIKRQLPKSE